MRVFFVGVLFLASLIGARASTSAEVATPDATQVALNSIGYLPKSAKIATVVGTGEEFVIRATADNAQVIRGRLVQIHGGSPDAAISVADFSSLEREGEYEFTVLGSAAPAARFRVGQDVYNWPFYCVFRAMYLWRCGTKVSTVFDGRRYQHAACHLDDAYLDYIGGTNDERATSTGGWHDAGDYNKYTVNGAFTVGMMLKAWEHFGKNLSRFKFDIPESSNALPDFLDEIRWELDWLLTMQTEDGRVYHKVSALNFGGFVLPEKDTDRRYFCPWGSAATATFAAVMAEAARAFRTIDPQYSSRCLAAAKVSYEFLRTHPAEHRPDLDAFSTGKYEAPDSDDRLWAAAELWETTGDAQYLRDCEERIRTFGGRKITRSSTVDPDWDWGHLRNLGVFTYLRSERSGRDQSLVDIVRKEAIATADEIVAASRRHPYARTLGATYYWGCNGTVTRQAMNLQIASQMTGSQVYRETMLDSLNYVFGRNPYERSFVTGLGVRPPMHPHDRRSGGNKIAPPWPGCLVGGAWPKETDWTDEEADYRTNEIAINWNGALIYALAAFVEPESFHESIKTSQRATATAGAGK